MNKQAGEKVSVSTRIAAVSHTAKERNADPRADMFMFLSVCCSLFASLSVSRCSPMFLSISICFFLFLSVFLCFSVFLFDVLFRFFSLCLSVCLCFHLCFQFLARCLLLVLLICFSFLGWWMWHGARDKKAFVSAARPCSGVCFQHLRSRRREGGGESYGLPPLSFDGWIS